VPSDFVSRYWQKHFAKTTRGLQKVRLSKLRVRNFRSIEDLELILGSISVLCGPNSCGKSNVLRAIEFAFLRDLDRESIYKNMIAKKRDQPGGPTLSIWIEMWFIACPNLVLKIAKAKASDEVLYRLRAYRSGKVIRTLNGEPLDETGLVSLNGAFQPVYVPTIRDPSSGGMDPFQRLFADVLRRSRGDMTMHAARKRACDVLQSKAEPLLREHKGLAGNILHSSGFEITTDGIDLDHLYREVGISVLLPDGKKMPLESLGTGHQSLFIIHLYRQLGESSPGHSLYLFEEPDNHLHPTTVRAMASDLIQLSQTAQVIVSTHSPMLVNLLGLENAHSLYIDKSDSTAVRKMDLGGYQENELRHLLMQYGIRATEPLFAKRIVLVEGPSDLQLLTRLIELRIGRSPDQLDVLLINAGGKDGVARLAELLTALGTEWKAVLDWDAAFSSETPYTATGFNGKDKASLIAAIQLVDEVLALETRRGVNARKQLKAIRAEVEGGTQFSGPTTVLLLRD
jgi:predicted ATP-dependent endonuclease of OLD family